MSVPFTFMHAADLHLDSPFRGLSKVPSAVRERLKASTFSAFRRLVETVRREQLDFLVLSGDLYDTADRSLRAQLRMQQALQELSADGTQVFVVHGNHDPDRGGHAKLDWPDTVHVFGTEEVGCVPAYTRGGELAAHVYGISYGQASITDNLALRYQITAGAPFHLALLHANVDGLPGYDNYAPCKLAELAASGFHYWALGHVHDRRILHEYPHVVYPGNTQGRSIRETGPKGAYTVKVSAQGEITMSFRDVSEVIWQELSVSIAGIAREQQLKDRMLETAAEARAGSDGRPVVLRIRLEGTGPLHEQLSQAHVTEEWLDELRDWLGTPEEREDWIWIERIVLRTTGESQSLNMAREEGFLGELTRAAAAAVQDAERTLALWDEAAQGMRRQPRLRDWLNSRSDAERAELVSRAADYAALLLREQAD